MLFKGYIDESYDKDFFVLSCTISGHDLWLEFERDWRHCLAEKNTALKLEGRREISRYHATDCQGKYKEFKGWTNEEQLALTMELLSAIKKAPSHSSAYTLLLSDLQEVYNSEFGVYLSTDQILAVAYTLTLPFCMYSIGKALVDLDPFARIALHHDQSEADSIISSVFSEYKKDPRAEYGYMFTSLTSEDSRNCLPLQAADFIAYEFFKDRKNENTRSGRLRRKSLAALLEQGAGVNLRTIPREVIERIRQMNLNQ